ncbi:MAG: abortive infection family protein [Candidatus Aquicultor sp.]
MNKDSISKATRNEFREALVAACVLREINDIFQGAYLEPRLDYEPPVLGQRRSLVEQYYVNIDFRSPADTQKLIAAYEEVIERLTKAESLNSEVTWVQTYLASLKRRMERDGFLFQSGRFIYNRGQLVLNHDSIVSLTQESISEHLNKASNKIEKGDHAGAIASAYTLLEGFLKEMLRKTDTPFNEAEGDIRNLYKLVSVPLNLNPSGDHLENYLKAIIDGLQRQISGLYEVANKASDRHARKYNPARHHAKLAVNAAFTLCEFLLESYEYQGQRKGQS